VLKTLVWNAVVLTSLLLTGSQRRLIAGYVILMADVTPAFSEQWPVNRPFFNNLLGPGDSVFISDNGGRVFYDYYSTLPNVTTRWDFQRQISSSLIGDADLVILTRVKRSVSEVEVKALTNFVHKGGNLLISFEWPNEFDADAHRNTMHELLSKMGTDLRVDRPYFDIGIHLASGDRVADHPLTRGVTSFAYGGASKVFGGTPLFLSREGHPIAAATFIPEPSSAVLFCVPLAFAFCGRR
jgi:hypothetical protein